MTFPFSTLPRSLALICALSAGPVVGQDLTPADLRLAAQLMLDDGQIASAAEVTDVLLANDPNDLVALILRAQIDLAAGMPDEAVTLAARAYRLAGDDETRYVAARLTARGHAEQLQDTRAQFWLRRARQFAPDDAAAQSVANDYRFVSDRNPLSLSFNFGISPTSNVNGGISTDTTDIVFLGLPFEYEPSPGERSLSGFAYDLGVNARYRVAEAENYITYYELNASGVTYSLSSEAKSLAPNARGSDYNSANLFFGVIHQRILRDGALPTTFSTRVGQTWYAGDLDRRYVELGASQSFLVGDRSTISLSVNGQKAVGRGETPAVESYSIGTSFGYAFENGNYGALFASYRISASDDTGNDFTSRRVGANFELGEPISTVQFGFGVDYEVRDYDFAFFAGGPRTDKTTTANINAALTEIEYYGFQPVAKIDASRTTSTVGIYERDYVNLGFEFQSAF